MGWAALHLICLKREALPVVRSQSISNAAGCYHINLPGLKHEPGTAGTTLWVLILTAGCISCACECLGATCGCICEP